MKPQRDTKPQRATKQRDAIRQVLLDAGRPLSPAEILELGQAQVENLALATVYRTIRLLVEAGDIRPVELPGEPARYEPRVPGRHHHYFQCDACGRVFEVEGCPGKLESLLPPGFSLSGHEVVLYGKCAECAA